MVIEAPDGIRAWVESRFAGLIGQAAGAVEGTAAPTVEFTTSGTGDPIIHSPAPIDEAAVGVEIDLDPRMTFDQFVICEGNRLAHAAALAAAEMPSQAYNPLFIHGDPGTGKTHLLHAIGNLSRSHSPELRVRFTTTEAFTARFVESVRRNETARFKETFREVDLLLVDDAQFLAGKAKTGEEFFHTFNAIVESGAQVVMTSDRTPAELELIEERLRDRFASGLVVDVTPPDASARLAILSMRVRRDALGDVPNEALEAISERIRGNVRSLEGALIRVVAYASLTGSRMTRDLATQVLDQLYPAASKEAPEQPGIGTIKQMVAEAYGVRSADLDSKSRSARVVWPRQVAMYLAREVAGEPLPLIGKSFGGRNHSTVVNACRRVRERLAEDAEEALAVRSLELRISSQDDRNE